MDNKQSLAPEAANQPTQAANNPVNSQAVQGVAGPTSTQQPAPGVPPAADSGGNKKLMVWLIGGLVVVALAVGGIYLFLSRQQTAQLTTQPSSAPSAQQRTDLDEELSEIELNPLDEEFSTVDQDLQNL